jgi:cytochrome P450
LRMELCELTPCWMVIVWPFLTTVPRFAGSDSTASTMQSFFYYVLSDPRVYAKLQQEVDEAQKTGQISSIVEYAEAMKLDYFQACLKEAMRIRPAVGLGIYRVVPPEGANIGGQFFPGGTEVSVNGWVLHRDTDVFGDDVETFRPERWFERDVKLMNSNMYQVSSLRSRGRSKVAY